MFKFRKATVSDAAAAKVLYQKIRVELGRSGDAAQWYRFNHPRDDQVDEWAKRGDLYLVWDADKNLVGTVVLDRTVAPGYEDVDWVVDAKDSQALMLHVLGVDPEHMGKGIARYLVDRSVEVGRKLGAKSLRLDTFYGNWPAYKLYQATGFSYRGVYALHYEGIDLDRFHVFEYVL